VLAKDIVIQLLSQSYCL